MSVARPLSSAKLLDISSGATCLADLDYGALALTKEASGNSGEHAEIDKQSLSFSLTTLICFQCFVIQKGKYSHTVEYSFCKRLPHTYEGDTGSLLYSKVIF